jgi:hypothetical protein
MTRDLISRTAFHLLAFTGSGLIAVWTTRDITASRPSAQPSRCAWRAGNARRFLKMELVIFQKIQDKKRSIFGHQPHADSI